MLTSAARCHPASALLEQRRAVKPYSNRTTLVDAARFPHLLRPALRVRRSDVIGKQARWPTEILGLAVSKIRGKPGLVCKLLLLGIEGERLLLFGRHLFRLRWDVLCSHRTRLPGTQEPLYGMEDGWPGVVPAKDSSAEAGRCAASCCCFASPASSPQRWLPRRPATSALAVYSINPICRGPVMQRTQRRGNDKEHRDAEINLHFQIAAITPSVPQSCLQDLPPAPMKRRACRERIHRSWLHLPRELHPLFPDLEVAIVENLGYDVSSIAQLVIDEIWRAVPDLIDRELLGCVRLDVGKPGVMVDRGNIERRPTAF